MATVSYAVEIVSTLLRYKAHVSEVDKVRILSLVASDP